MELKRNKALLVEGLLAGSNRTFMELKQRYYKCENEHGERSNRTFMELKLIRRNG